MAARPALAAAIALLALAALPASAFEVDAVAELVRVVDGDTIVVRIIADSPDPPVLPVGAEYRVRLADINAPELGTREGEEARDALEDLLAGADRLYLDVDDMYVTDKYGRLVAVVYVEQDGVLVNVNWWLVYHGYAEVWDHENEFDPYAWGETQAPATAAPEGGGEAGAPWPLLAALVLAALALARLGRR